jgi:hypothetical protein
VRNVYVTDTVRVGEPDWPHGVAQFLARVENEQTVCGRHYDLRPCTGGQDRHDALHHSAAGGNHIVHDQARAAGNVSDHMGHLGIGAAHAPLMQHGDGRAEALLRVACRHPDPSDVRGDHDQIGRHALAQGPAKRWHGRHAVHRSMEESLDLGRVHIDRDDMADADGFQRIGDNPRHDRLPPAVTLVSPAVAEEGHDRRDTGGAAAPAGIRQSHQLDQVIVDWRRGRLHEKDLLALHGFQMLHGNFAIGIPIHDTGAEPGAELAAIAAARAGLAVPVKIVKSLLTPASGARPGWPLSSGYRSVLDG